PGVHADELAATGDPDPLLGRLVRLDLRHAGLTLLLGPAPAPVPRLPPVGRRVRWRPVGPRRSSLRARPVGPRRSSLRARPVGPRRASLRAPPGGARPASPRARPVGPRRSYLRAPPASPPSRLPGSPPEHACGAVRRGSWACGAMRL